VDSRDLDEAVAVRADFVDGQIYPRAFKREGERLDVTSINARWVDREGDCPLHYFSVQAANDTWFIGLRTGDMVWKLVKRIVNRCHPLMRRH